MNLYKLYAAMHEEITESVVWLKKDLGKRPRSVVKITNTDNNHCVFCEALQFDENFLTRYHKPESKRIKIDNPEASIVMSYWYRARLGSGEALKTQEEYPLRIDLANRWYGKLRASMHDPHVGVRVSVHVALWLGILGVVLGTIGLLTSIGRASRTIAKATPARDSALSVDGVLAWRATYGDLLGKPREAVIERFGTARKSDGDSDSALSWDSSPKTGNRSVTVFFESAASGSTVQAVKVFAGLTESLDAIEILKKAPLFEFETGTYKDALIQYFVAKAKDGRNAFQFNVSDAGVKFNGIVFAQNGMVYTQK
jgi:hypothetical protein